jgi:hypothetical protein
MLYPDDAVKISSGGDLRVWLSVALEAGFTEDDCYELAQRIVRALDTVGLRLVAPGHPEDGETAARLAQGEALCVEPDA